MEEVDVLSLRASEAAAEIAFITVRVLRPARQPCLPRHMAQPLPHACRLPCATLHLSVVGAALRPCLGLTLLPATLIKHPVCRASQSSNSAYSLTGHAEKLATMLKQLESEQDDPSNSSVVMIQVQ